MPPPHVYLLVDAARIAPEDRPVGNLVSTLFELNGVRAAEAVVDDPSSVSSRTRRTMLTRFLRLQLGKVHHRLFPLDEYLGGCRGRPMPAHLVSQIMRRPADAEDWVHLLRFVGPEEPVFLVDVGANVGDFTHGFLACYRDAEAVCLDPVRGTPCRHMPASCGQRS